MKFADATGVETWGPGPLEPHHQLELAWYAIHPIELLYTLMGPAARKSAAPLRRMPTCWWGAGKTAASAPCGLCGPTAITARSCSAPKRFWKRHPAPPIVTARWSWRS